METLWSVYEVTEASCPEVDLYDEHGNFIYRTPAWVSFSYGYELPDRVIVRQEVHIKGKVDRYLMCEWKNPDGYYSIDDIASLDFRLHKQAWRKELREKNRYN